MIELILTCTDIDVYGVRRMGSNLELPAELKFEVATVVSANHKSYRDYTHDRAQR